MKHWCCLLLLVLLVISFLELISLANGAFIPRNRIGNQGGSSGGGGGGYNRGEFGQMGGMGPYWDLNSNGSDVDTMHDEQLLLARLLWNYDPAARPVYNASHAVDVKFSFSLIQLCDMDERNQILTTNVWLENEWIDERLTWNKSEYNDMDKIRVPCSRVWLPDIVLYNSADDYTEGYMQAKVLVGPEGDVFWSPPAKLRSSCKIDVTFFPFDDQTCFLKFGSWTYSGLQLNLINRTSEVDVSNYIPSGEWELRGAIIERNVQFYPCCPSEPYYDIHFYIFIRRKVLYYLFNIIIPCIWLSVLSVIGFWLPPDSGEKVTLGITVLLAFSVFMLLIAENIPATSETVPLIGIYLTAVMSLTSMSIILTVLVLQLHHSGQFAPAMPKKLYTFCTVTIANLFCMNEIVRRFEADRFATSNKSTANHRAKKPKDYSKEDLESALIECQHNFNQINYDLGSSLKKQKPRGLLCLPCLCCCLKSSDTSPESGKQAKKTQIITDRTLNSEIKFIKSRKGTITSLVNNDQAKNHVKLIQHENQINYDILADEHDLVATQISRPNKYIKKHKENTNVLVNSSLFKEKEETNQFFNPLQLESLKTRLASTRSPGANRHNFNLSRLVEGNSARQNPRLTQRPQQMQPAEMTIIYPDQVCYKCITKKGHFSNQSQNPDQDQDYLVKSQKNHSHSPVSLRNAKHININHVDNSGHRRLSQKQTQGKRNSSVESQGRIIVIKTRQDLIDENLMLQKEWKLLALIFDRVLFWVFTVLIGASSVFLLCVVPLMKDGTIAIPKK